MTLNNEIFRISEPPGTTKIYLEHALQEVYTTVRRFVTKKWPTRDFSQRNEPIRIFSNVIYSAKW